MANGFQCHSCESISASWRNGVDGIHGVSLWTYWSSSAYCGWMDEIRVAPFRNLGMMIPRYIPTQYRYPIVSKWCELDFAAIHSSGKLGNPVSGAWVRRPPQWKARKTKRGLWWPCHLITRSSSREVRIRVPTFFCSLF